MSQHYSDPERENDPHALPNVETFYVAHAATWNAAVDCPRCNDIADNTSHGDHVGWYWWACFPGCLPDGEPIGPFPTKAEALADAQDGAL
jgi:hypothetical protein